MRNRVHKQILPRIMCYLVWITIVVVSLCEISEAVSIAERKAYSQNVLLEDNKGKFKQDISAMDNIINDIGNLSDNKDETMNSLPHHRRIRDRRAATYKTNDYLSQKHIERIPSTKPKSEQTNRSGPPPDSLDETTFESLEANRDAFLDMLADNLSRPKRKRPTASRQNKIKLSYDFKTKRYSITEDQSNEF